MTSYLRTCIAIVIVTILAYWRATNICSVVTEQSQAGTALSRNLPMPMVEPEPRETKKPARKRQYDPSIFDIDVANYNGPARAFPTWEHPFPCFPTPRRLMVTTPSKLGLLFQRPHKTGSTTVAGIVMRIAHRHAQREIKNKKLTVPPPNPKNPLQQAMTREAWEADYRKNLFCDHRANHGSSVHFQYALRDKRRSFLFSIVRNPTQRAISHFFHFGVSAYGKEPSDRSFRQHLMGMAPNRFLQDLSMYPINRTDTSIDYEEVVRIILEEYDFIAILERFDESLVALKMVLGLDFEDILYVRERSEGTFSNGDQKRPCVFILPSFLTPGTTEFLTSGTWKSRIEGDVMLYQAVHKSLDLTIDKLGREEFQRQLALFQQVNRRANDLCASRSVGMCTAGGAPVPIANRTCYIWSEGCSHACLDEIRIQDSVTRRAG